MIRHIRPQPGRASTPGPSAATQPPQGAPRELVAGPGPGDEYAYSKGCITLPFYYIMSYYIMLYDIMLYCLTYHVMVYNYKYYSLC